MKRTQSNRTCFLVDLENVVGTGQITTDSAGAFAAWWRHQLTPRRDDLTIVAVSPFCAFEAHGAFPSARLLTRHGHDGADLALLDVMRGEQLHQRFSRVVLASGDGIFTDDISRLAGRGCHTQVLAPRGSLSRRLRLAAHDHLLFDLTAAQMTKQDAS